MLIKNHIYSCFLVMLAFLMPLSAVAYNKSWDQGHLTCVVEPGSSNWGKFDKSGVFHGGYTSKDCCEKYCKVCPVYANTGQLQESFTDLTLSGVGPSLTIKRTYNSQDWATSFLGKGWTFNFGKRIIVARRSDNEKIIGLILETGEKNYYKENPDGSLERLTGYGASFDLIKNADGSYTVKDLDGSRTELKADGKIDKIFDRNNNQLTFDYNPVGCVSRITNASGNYIDFQLGPNGKITSAADNHGRTISYDYDTEGNLVSVTDPLGNTQQYIYNSDNLLTQRIDARDKIVETINYDTFQPPRVSSFVEKGETFTIAYFSDRTEKTDSQGNKWTYYYNDVGVIERTIDPLGNETKQSLNRITATSVDWEEDANGNRTTYTYDAFGNFTSRTDALGNTWTYTYVAGSDWVETEVDPFGTVAKYQYDAKGNRTAATHDYAGLLAKSTTSTFDASGNVIRATDPLGNTTTNVYATNGNLIQMTDALGNISAYTYDSRGNLLAKTNADGKKTVYTYDLMDRLLTVTDALNNETSYVYDANGNKISVTDASGNTHAYVYDAYDRLIQVTNPLETSIKNSYDWRGNLLSHTDANGNTTTFTYDILDRLIKVTDASGGQIVYVYDPAGNNLSVKDVNGKVISFSYDADNRMTSKTNYANEITSYGYDLTGRLVSITHPNGNTIVNSYDVLGRLINISDSLGLFKSYSYDANDYLLSLTDALGNKVSYTYDTIGRIIKETDALGNSYSYLYDSIDNLVESTDREGNITTRVYDELNRKTSETDATGNVTIFSYDGVGNLLSITDANGNRTIYTYDSLNRLVQETYADGTTRTFSYDPVGNRTARTDQNGQTTVYTYDKLNRRTKIDYPGTNDSIFAYDAVGNLLSANNQDSTITHTYDDAYRMTQSVQNGKTVAYSYDITRGEKTITYPGGKALRMIRNHRNLLTDIEDTSSQALVQYTYDDANRSQEKNYLNGISATYNYNSNGWITDLAYGDGAEQLIEYQYGFDREGNIQHARSAHDSSDSEKYGYDKKYRLNEFKRGVLDASDQIPTPLTHTSYNLDALANWQSKTTNGITENRIHNENNEVVDIDGITFDYHGNGNLVDDGFNSYQYDYENRLVSVTRKSDGVILGAYKYDALGRRIEKQVSGAKTSYFYDDDRVIEEQSEGAASGIFVYGDGVDEVELMERGGAAYYYHTNSIGSVVALTDSSATVVEEYQYDAYGKPVIISSVGNPYMFTGRPYDVESGLQYNRNRYYSSALGRWITQDPMGYVDSFNLYEYVGSNPINFIDPFGLILTVSGDTVDALKQLNKLCPGQQLENKGGLVTGDCCEQPSKYQYSCECLCSVILAAETYNVEVSNPVKGTQLVAWYDGTQRNIPWPLPGPHTNGNNVVVSPSSGSNFVYGMFDTTGGLISPASTTRIIGHELCGHAWKDYGYANVPGTKGKGPWGAYRPGHDDTIREENKVAVEHGEPLRGLISSPKQGESTHRLHNEATYYYGQMDGWHSGP